MGDTRKLLDMLRDQQLENAKQINYYLSIIDTLLEALEAVINDCDAIDIITFASIDLVREAIAKARN